MGDGEIKTANGGEGGEGRSEGREEGG